LIGQGPGGKEKEERWNPSMLMSLQRSKEEEEEEKDFGPKLRIKV